MLYAWVWGVYVGGSINCWGKAQIRKKKKILTFDFCSSVIQRQITQPKRSCRKGGESERNRANKRTREEKLVSDVWSMQYIREHHCQCRDSAKHCSKYKVKVIMNSKLDQEQSYTHFAGCRWSRYFSIYGHLSIFLMFLLHFLCGDGLSHQWH